MLTAETKRHIDSARQVLVGKVPDPKQQIDQITNALIYKFMDDMDEQARMAGGHASFFKGDLEQYAWRKLMDPRKGAQERLNIYTEALEKFSTAQQLPQLFRDIFRQAFLPYRDPETLNLFLKEIEFFDYNHSEELGNAFEYLLSIMGSQGDAGQFRTPRHIIDFMVDVIDPDYTDTILDPACGTAGFLISAYKHIIDKHDGVGEKAQKNNEISLTHRQRQQLFDNMQGYDISSDMVKLARVNMYLHGNNQPNIFEYDTLSSEQRWNDNFDIIMANPPFMSPKGGIRPHNKFGVESSRAEVLFVDYIMSHLKQNGRAGVIVPEGIIFQSGIAYKQLRKSLLEDGLLAVISLPAGVFNPYSGVKTSILIFDNNRAKKTEHIAFAKVEHDGYTLGAQRRPTPGKNDLPVIAKVLKSFRLGKLTTQAQIDDFLESEAALRETGSFSEVIDIKLVERTKIAESSDYNLSASRYVVTETNQHQKWPMIALADICEIYQPKTITSKEISNQGPFPVYGANGIIGRYSKANHENPEVVITCRGATCGTVNMTSGPAWITGNAMVVSPKNDRLLKSFVYYLLKNHGLTEVISGSAQPQITRSSLAPFIIPIPPIDVQKQIVEELDGYQKIIDAAKEMYQARSLHLAKNSSWVEKPFDEVASLEYGKALPIRIRKEGKYPVMGSNGISGYHNAYLIKGPGIVIGRKGSAGEVTWIEEDFYPIDTTYYIKLKDKSLKLKFLYIQLLDKNLGQLRNGAGVPGLNRDDVYRNIKIPIPAIKEQEKLVKEYENVKRMLIDQNLETIKFFEKKIRDKTAEAWG